MGISVKDFSKCCRCCLVMVDDMKPLFGACLNVMLMKVMNLQATPTDGLPQQMCFRCVLKLSSAYTFYITVLKNQKTLENIFKTAVENGDIPAIVASHGENEELNIPEKDANIRDKEHSVLETLCIQHLKFPKETITPKQTSKSKTNIPRKVNCGKCESESEEFTDNEAYKCSQCKHSFKDEEDLKIHLQTHLGGNSQRKGEADIYSQLCNICGSCFRRRTSLHKHLRAHRERERERERARGPRRCPHCAGAFAEPAALRAHLVSHSSEQKPYRCNICSRPFTQRSSRDRHARRHGDKRQLPCDQCDKSFLHKYSLHRHRESAHSINECAVCNKLFTGKKLLDMHMRYHKKEEMECSSREIPHNNSVLTGPIDIQTVTVQFLCLLCSTKFQTRKNLEVHTCTKENIT